MRYLLCTVVFVFSASLAGSAVAEDDPAGENGRRAGRGELRQKLLEEFDADGDGKLSDEEHATARKKMRGRRGRDGTGRQGDGSRQGGAKGGGKGSRRGSRGPGPPDPEKLFEQFDADGDDQLSRDEFHKLAHAMRERHEHHRQGQGRPGDEGRGDRFGRPEGPEGRRGPPPERRSEFRARKPLQNPDDRRGPPARFRREGPQRPGNADAADRRGLPGRRPPNPDALFDRFDDDSDGQLSRQEFAKLSAAMRELRERFGRDRGRRAGENDDEGRRGRRGHDNDPYRPKHQPPESEEGAATEASPAEEESV